MASLAHAALPSSDEEDDDYDPTADPTGEKEDRAPGSGGKKRGADGGKRRRGAGAAADGAGDNDDDEGDAAAARRQQDYDEGEPELTPAQAAKKAKVGALFDELHQAATGSANKLSRNSISLASLCSTVDRSKKRNTDMLWMRNLGITPGSSKRASGASPASTPGSIQAAAAAAGAGAAAAAGSTPGGGEAAQTAAGSEAAGPSSSDGKQEQQQQQGGASEAARAAAEAALAAAKEVAAGGVGRSYNKVALTETRRFAGKEIEVTVHVDKDSKEARAAAERSAKAASASGLDAFLKNIEAKKKVTVLDKTKMDWRDFKTHDKEVQEELAAHARSDKQYLDKQEFLQRAELREYELERDKRLASDVRLRGRL